MYDHRDDIPPPMPGEDDVVRRRLLWGLWGAVAVTVIAAIPGVLLGRGGDTKNLTSAQPFLPVTTTVTTVAAAPTAGEATPPAPAPTTTVPKGVVTPVRATPSATTTTARPVVGPSRTCRNSYDPACGPFRWDPDPGNNQALTVTVTPLSQQGKAGQAVNFHVVADDPDARIARDCVVIDFGDGQAAGGCPPAAACPAPYGPWTPPARAPDHYEFTAEHRYMTATAAGQAPYVASFRLESHSFCSPDPYGGSAAGSATVTVSA